jgi:hypothetical protein
MTDDIVTRLREKYSGQLPICSEAADEIERLQQLVEHLSSQLRLQMKANDKAWEAYKEVVGDD